MPQLAVSLSKDKKGVIKGIAVSYGKKKAVFDTVGHSVVISVENGNISVLAFAERDGATEHIGALVRSVKKQPVRYLKDIRMLYTYELDNDEFKAIAELDIAQEARTYYEREQEIAKQFRIHLNSK